MKVAEVGKANYIGEVFNQKLYSKEAERILQKKIWFWPAKYSLSYFRPEGNCLPNLDQIAKVAHAHYNNQLERGKT